MLSLKFRKHIFNLHHCEAGAVTVDWVVLTALAVGLLGAAYGAMEDGTLSLADGTSSYLSTYLD